jgi:hypothetical protein
MKIQSNNIFVRLIFFFFVLVPIFLTSAFYLLSGSFWDTPHYNPLTSQWKYYTPISSTNLLESKAEQTISLLNQGLTDEEEYQIIQYFKDMRIQYKMNDFLAYLKNKRFQNRNALELLILRFDEAIYQRGLSVEFLLKATIATTTNLIPHPKRNFPQANKNYLIDLLTVICLDSNLNVNYFEEILQYNVYAWTWHNNRDNGRYQFDETYKMQDICLTQRTLAAILPQLFAQPSKVNSLVWKRIYDLLDTPKCRNKGKFIDYTEQKEKIKIILKVSTM